MEDGAEKSVEDRVVKQENRSKGKILHKMEGCEMMIIRFMGVVLSLAAAVVAGVDEESRVISLATLAPCLPPLDLSVTAKWHYLSSTVSVTFSSSNSLFLLPCHNASFVLYISLVSCFCFEIIHLPALPKQFYALLNIFRTMHGGSSEP